MQNNKKPLDYQEIQKIQTNEDFVLFLKALRQGYLEDSESWENLNIESFLWAMASWVEDMDGFYLNHNLPFPKKPDWKDFANILMGAKVYE